MLVKIKPGLAFRGFVAYILVHCLYQMLTLNHKRTTNSLVPPILYVANNWQLIERRFPIVVLECCLVIPYHFIAVKN